MKWNKIGDGNPTRWGAPILCYDKTSGRLDLIDNHDQVLLGDKIVYTHWLPVAGVTTYNGSSNNHMTWNHRDVSIPKTMYGKNVLLYAKKDGYSEVKLHLERWIAKLSFPDTWGVFASGLTYYSYYYCFVDLPAEDNVELPAKWLSKFETPSNRFVWTNISNIQPSYRYASVPRITNNCWIPRLLKTDKV